MDLAYLQVQHEVNILSDEAKASIAKEKAFWTENHFFQKSTPAFLYIVLQKYQIINPIKKKF